MVVMQIARDELHPDLRSCQSGRCWIGQCPCSSPNLVVKPGGEAVVQAGDQMGLQGIARGEPRPITPKPAAHHYRRVW